MFNVNLEDLIIYAEDTMKYIPNGIVFTSKDLFQGYYWNNLSKKMRKKFGSWLYQNYKTLIPNFDIKCNGKTPQNIYTYIMINNNKYLPYPLKNINSYFIK